MWLWDCEWSSKDRELGKKGTARTVRRCPCPDMYREQLLNSDFSDRIEKSQVVYYWRCPSVPLSPLQQALPGPSWIWWAGKRA